MFYLAAALALALHAGLVFARDGLHGGGDLLPHLRLILETGAQPGLHNTYAPAYHLLGAALVPLLGPALYAKLFALAAAVLLVAGFRSFQRVAGLPDASAALFVLTPYLLSLSWCTPKVEAAGYGVLFFGLAALLRGRAVICALLLGACFAVHTASALLFGLAGGVLSLARRDLPGLVALASGALLASPLIAVHWAAGCSVGEALLFAPGGYAIPARGSVLPESWPWLAPLANPFALGAALLGAPALWRAQRPLAVLCGVLLVVYLSNFWLAPFGERTLLTPLRGLSILAVPVAVAAGTYAAAAPRARPWILALSAVWAVGSSVWVVPHACSVRPVDPALASDVRVERCTFRWRQDRSAQSWLGSPSDGLVFVRREGESADLVRARLADGAVRPLLATPDRDEAWPLWSAAQGRLLFESKPRGSRLAELLLLDPSRGEVARLSDRKAIHEHWATWSRDGRLAYAFVPGPDGASGVALLDPASGRLEILAEPVAGVRYLRLGFAPDGRRIVAQRNRGTGSTLWLLQSGEAPRPLTGASPRREEKGLFTRDGAHVVFTRRSAPDAPGELVMVRSDGSGERVLASNPAADDFHAAPSPARDEIAFLSDRSGGLDAWLVGLDGGEPRRLSRTPERDERAPRWSPDGEWLALTSLPAGARGDPRILVIDREGRVRIELEGSMPDWMPPWGRSSTFQLPDAAPGSQSPGS